MIKGRKWIAALAVILSLSACGGGDGDISDVVSGNNAAPAAENELGEINISAVPALSIGADNLPEPGQPTTKSTTNVKVYTPAQIRAAYNMPPLPASYDNLTPEQRAQLGAGQTIYVIGAYNNPALIDDLNKFSQTFGLPTCAYKVLPKSTTALPEHSKSAGCELNVAYVYMTGLTDTPPKYNETWAREMALDTQWAHAVAPLARIVVIKSPSAFVNALYDSTMIANKMGPGVVSMSFVASEYNPTDRYPRDWVNPMDRGIAGRTDGGFRRPGMIYFAAAGDWGGKDINVWPASSPSVIGVGGTSLQFDGVTRSETTWGKSGGSWSRFVTAPYYQQNLTNNFYAGTSPLLTFATSETPNQRPASTVDVAFNADPTTGQYTHITSLAHNLKTITTYYYYAYNNTARKIVTTSKEYIYNGKVVDSVAISSVTTTIKSPTVKVNSQTVEVQSVPAQSSWYSMGGTSIATPQWAGIAATINAQRQLRGQPMIGNFQEGLYTLYSSAMQDVMTGSNGADCRWCISTAGYDAPTGMGTPNVLALTGLMVN